MLNVEFLIKMMGQGGQELFRRDKPKEYCHCGILKYFINAILSLLVV